MTTNTITAGNAATPFFSTLGGNDGTLLVTVGPVGAQVAALSIDALGNLTDKNGKVVGGARTLFSATYSNVAFIDIPNVITSAYDLYEIELYEVFARTNTSDLQLRGSIDNGVSFLTGHYASRVVTTSGVVNGFNQAGATNMTLGGGVSSTGGLSLTVKLNPAPPASGSPRASWTGGFWYSPGTADSQVGGSGSFNTPSAINAIRLVMSAGNIDAKVIIKGIGK